MATTISATFKVGDTPVVVNTDGNAAGIKALFRFGGFFANIPTKCGNCQSKNLTLNGQKNAGYEFYSVLCKDCKHEMKYGTRKEDGGLFLKEDEGWHPPYSKGSGSSGGQRQSGGGGGGGGDSSGGDDDGGDDIPF